MTQYAILRDLILRELHTMQREVLAYRADEELYFSLPGISNTGGNIALHCAGNLQHFIGARLGHSGFVRNRDLEFTDRTRSRDSVAAELAKTADAVRDALTGRQLPHDFPDKVGDRSLRTEVFLTHLAVHLGYHLGQLDYHRRIATGDNTTLDAVSIKELPE